MLTECQANEVEYNKAASAAIEMDESYSLKSSANSFAHATHTTKLGCKYMLDFNQLPLFLRGLIDNNLIFSEELLPN
jgi:hypothetical protein